MSMKSRHVPKYDSIHKTASSILPAAVRRRLWSCARFGSGPIEGEQYSYASRGSQDQGDGMAAEEV